MIRNFKWIRFGLAAVLAMAISNLFAADKIKIEKLDDLPRHTYKIDMKAVELLSNEAALKKLATEVKKDIEDDLAKYEIGDATTVQNFYAWLGSVALIEHRWDDYLETVAVRMSLEDKEANKYTTALIGRSIARSQKKGLENYEQNVYQEAKAMLDAMPYAVVEANLKSTKGSTETVQAALVLGSIESSIQPTLDGSNGVMSQSIATGLLSSYFTLNFYIPVKEQIRRALEETIAANHIEKEDIWTAREVELKPGDGKEPVLLCVWDSGVDTKIFEPLGQLWTNTKEIADNGKDDDNNGYVDDVHGVAYSLHSDKETSLLYPIGDVSGKEDELRSQMKGLSDIGSAIDSKEATGVKQKLGQLKQDEVKPFIEEIGLYGNYCHGTHVAGISAKGNPYAHLLVSRITFDHHIIPETPTIEQAEKDAAATVDVINYYKKMGVRAVNMSWGGSLASIEDALEKNNAGGTPEERKALARKIYDIGDKSFRKAIQDASEILFVTSAGNSDADVNFEEFYPSSYDYPNVLTVGAVDQAGDETSFTSFGKTDVYANGFEVLSYVPGGSQLKLNGTSMSSPQVLNLVGKLLAVNPKLTPTQLRKLVIDGADEKKAGDRMVRLMNPKKSLELLERM